MKPTKKARVVKPQSKKKIGKPLSKFTKVQSTSTLSKLEDTGKNFYEAGKEVANKGTDLLKQISAVPEKGLSEVVKMAIKAEQDAAYGRKVVMILGMILSTLMFLFTRLGQDYQIDEKYDPKISLPYGYGIVKGGEDNSNAISVSNQPLPKYGFKTTQHSVWSVAASTLALTLLGRAAFMNKKEQFYYFVDFIIAFLVCSVVYFILVGIFGKKGDNDAFITNDSFFDKKDAATGYAVETFNAAYNGIVSLFKSKKAVSDTLSGVAQSKKDQSKEDQPKEDQSKGAPSTGGKKRSKRRNKVTRGGMSTGISTQTVLVALTGVLDAIVLTSEKRRNIFSERLNKMIQYIKNNVSSKKEIV
jgi:hypothetical protein